MLLYRPDYAKLGLLKKVFPRTPYLCMTATASTHVRTDVLRILNLLPEQQSCIEIEQELKLPLDYDENDVFCIDDDDNITCTNSNNNNSHNNNNNNNGKKSSIPGYMLPPVVFIGDFNRPNLRYDVWKKTNDFDADVLLVISALKTVADESPAIVYCFSQSMNTYTLLHKYFF